LSSEIQEGSVAVTPIYTIGHGNRSLEAFLELLQRYGINHVIDVRSQPYSRYIPHFSRAALEQSLNEHHIQYVFMGDTLGGRPKDANCYRDGKPQYDIIRAKPFYQQGIARLRVVWEKQLCVALLCSEAKPQECHRSKLIGNTLVERQIQVSHIDENGYCKDQQAINMLLTGGQQLLFEDLSPIEAIGKIGRARKKLSTSDRNREDDGL
jgi:uncharacterized protein (DUF488 family)